MDLLKIHYRNKPRFHTTWWDIQYFLFKCRYWVFNYLINPHFNHFWWNEEIQYISFSDVWILMIFFKVLMIETNFDSIILRKLEIFVNWDLSIIGRVRFVKKTRQSWWQKVGVILKVDIVKSNWIELFASCNKQQQQNVQLSSTQLHSPENGQLYYFCIFLQPAICNVIWIWLFELSFCQHLSRWFCQCYLDGCDYPAIFWR